MYTAETYNPFTHTGPVSAAVIVDITATFEMKARALAAHNRTQPITGHFGPMAGTLARLWGARIGLPCGESVYAGARARPATCHSTAVTTSGKRPARDRNGTSATVTCLDSFGIHASGPKMRHTGRRPAPGRPLYCGMSGTGLVPAQVRSVSGRRQLR